MHAFSPLRIGTPSTFQGGNTNSLPSVILLILWVGLEKKHVCFILVIAEEQAFDLFVVDLAIQTRPVVLFRQDYTFITLKKKQRVAQELKKSKRPLQPHLDGQRRIG